MTYSLGTRAQNQRSTVNTTTYPQGFLSFAGISVTQPLLRGFGFNAAYADVRIARADRSISDWQFRQTAIDTVTNVIAAYSDLAFAQQQLRINQRSRALAAGLLDENERRYKVGSMSASDVTQARARTATRDEAVLLAEQGVSDATNRLRQLIGETDFPIDPSTFALELASPPDVIVEPAQDLKTALELRPDYQAAKLGLVKNVTREKSARNHLLPEVDFVGSYGYVGLDTTFAASRRMVADRENRSYSAGVVVSVPLTFSEGRGRLRAARLQSRQAEADLTRLKLDIAVSIAHAAGEIRTTRRRVAANHAAYDLAKQALDAELKKLRAGTSTTFFVLNLQEQLAGVESSLYNSLADQRRAIAFYDREIGRTLLVHHLTLDQE
jgi:outer membrane protein TolC